MVNLPVATSLTFGFFADSLAKPSFGSLFCSYFGVC